MFKYKYKYHSIQYDKDFYFNELNIVEFKELQKILLCEDYNDLFVILNNFINHQLNDIEDLKFNDLEIFLIICLIFSNSYSDEKQYVKETKEKKYLKTLSLSDIYNKIYDRYKKNNYDFSIDDFKFKLKISNLIDENDVFNFIKSIQYNNKIQEFEHLSINDKLLCIDNLPVDIFKELIFRIEDLIKAFKIELINMKDDKLPFSLNRVNLFYIIKVFFKINLVEYYKNMYFIQNNLNISLSDLNTITFNEAKMFMDINEIESEKINNNVKNKDSILPS